MKMKRMIPIALALTVAATSAAGAAYRPVKAQVSGRHSQAMQQLQGRELQKLCEKYGFSFCGRLPECPAGKPDQTPDTKPEETPDVKPDTKPDQTPDTKPEEKPEGGQTQGNYAAEVVRLVNAERAKNGLSALTVSAGVQSAAQVRAKEINQSFSHTRPNGSSCFTALKEAGVSYRGAGENIAYGQATPAAVMNAWMNSEGHRANILNGSFTTIGIGYTVINGTPYWTQMFTS